MACDKPSRNSPLARIGREEELESGSPQSPDKPEQPNAPSEAPQGLPFNGRSYKEQAEWLDLSDDEIYDASASNGDSEVT